MTFIVDRRMKYKANYIPTFTIDSTNSASNWAYIYPPPSTNTIALQLDIKNNLFDPFHLLPAAVEPVATSPFDPLLVKVLSGSEIKGSDFNIVAEDHIYAVHSCILPVRCPYFKQFFEESAEEWVEKSTKQLEVKFSKKAMDEVSVSQLYHLYH